MVTSQDHRTQDQAHGMIQEVQVVDQARGSISSTTRWWYKEVVA